MRTLRYVVGGSVVAVLAVGIAALAIAVVAAMFRFNDLLGWITTVAITGGVIGLLMLDATRDQERLDKFMFTRPDYPDDHGE
jgi:predicted membrane protein